MNTLSRVTYICICVCVHVCACVRVSGGYVQLKMELHKGYVARNYQLLHM